MTTTMDAHIGLQNPPLEQARPNHLPANNPSPAQATSPENAETRPPDINHIDPRARKKLQNEQLRALSKTFGDIPNVPVFAQWDSRADCCDSAVHRSIMAGICGNSTDGAYSIALSSLYKDDEDGGDVIIYTGSGGRKRWTDGNPPKRLRLGPQIMDQSWDDSGNKALIVSYLSGNPVRVIRSWRCPSQYAPVQGFRYDGLYKVAAYWTAKGRNGKKICRCRLERLPDQPPIPLRPITLPTTSKKKRKERFISRPCSPSSSTNSYDNPNGTDYDVGRNHPDSSATQLAGSTAAREAGRVLDSQQQEAVPETPAGTDFNMGDIDLDVKSERPRPLKRRLSLRPDALPRYRWDAKRGELVRLPAANPTPVAMDTAGGDEDEYRGEDDATLVPSEDGQVDTSVNARMETEYFSDRGTPRLDEPRASGPSVLEAQGHH